MKKKFRLKRLLIILFLLYASYSFISQQFTIRNIKRETVTAQKELSKLQSKNQKLQDEVKMSKTDAYIEKLARELLNLIKPDETPVINSK